MISSNNFIAPSHAARRRASSSMHQHLAIRVPLKKNCRNSPALAGEFGTLNESAAPLKMKR